MNPNYRRWLGQRHQARRRLTMQRFDIRREESERHTMLNINEGFVGELKERALYWAEKRGACSTNGIELVGAVIKDKREELEISRASLAEKIGVLPDWMLFFEAGLAYEGELTDCLINSLAESLSLDPLYIKLLAQVGTFNKEQPNENLVHIREEILDTTIDEFDIAYEPILELSIHGKISSRKTEKAEGSVPISSVVLGLGESYFVETNVTEEAKCSVRVYRTQMQPSSQQDKRSSQLVMNWSTPSSSGC